MTVLRWLLRLVVGIVALVALLFVGARFHDGPPRPTWILVHEGQAYVPCSLGFPPGKSWYKQAVVDGRATLRIEGKRYPVTLSKLDDAATPELRPVSRA